MYWLQILFYLLVYIWFVTIRINFLMFFLIFCQDTLNFISKIYWNFFIHFRIFLQLVKFLARNISLCWNYTIYYFLLIIIFFFEITKYLYFLIWLKIISLSNNYIKSVTTRKINYSFICKKLIIKRFVSGFCISSSKTSIIVLTYRP
jgi:hypothetical protein